MSRYAHIKGEFRKHLVATGATSVTPTFDVPEHIQERWIRAYHKPLLPPEHSHRLVNHFLVGADPEFVFVHPSGDRYSAENLQLQAGPAFGADNNGRLAEIRPKPSRSVIEVLASIQSTLKWMAVYHPGTVDLAWRGGAYFANDGLGGHIHFGRFRPNREREISALDTIVFWLTQLNVYDREEGVQRVKRAQGGPYGQLGDVRKQAYGYEYRTPPSWLDSPALALLYLTLSKLAVHDPWLVPVLSEAMLQDSTASVRAKLLALLAYYKGLDDDAAIAHWVISKYGFPRADTTDFKARWGIQGVPPIQPPTRIPKMIPPSGTEVRELVDALLDNRPPDVVELEPTWVPSHLPEGYTSMMHRVDTATRHSGYGLGELAIDICVPSKLSLRLRSYDGKGSTVFVCDRFVRNAPPDWWQTLKRRYPEVSFRTDDGESGSISLSRDLRDSSGRSLAMRILTGGMFPLFRVEEATLKSWDEYTTRMKESTAPKKTHPTLEARIKKSYRFVYPEKPSSFWLRNPQ